MTAFGRTGGIKGHQRIDADHQLAAGLERQRGMHGADEGAIDEGLATMVTAA